MAFMETPAFWAYGICQLHAGFEAGLQSDSVIWDSRVTILRHCEPTGRANARPMTGSAKQSILSLRCEVDCFVAYAPRNDGCNKGQTNV
jgi:hypothetical protein